MRQWRVRSEVQQRGLWLIAASLLAVPGCGGPDVGPSAPTGSIIVGAFTVGPGSDEDGYLVALDGVVLGAIGSAGNLQLDNVEVGTHVVKLDGLEPNCSTFAENNSSSVVIKGGDTVEVTFTVSCSHNPASIEVTTITSGPLPDSDGYMLSVDGSTPEPIGVNATVLVKALTPTTHTVSLSGLAPNCQVDGANPQTTGYLGYGEKAQLTFNITCPA